MDGLAIASAKAGRPLPIRNDLAMLIVAPPAAETMPAELYARIHEFISGGDVDPAYGNALTSVRTR
jgi:hypothetical protein